MVPPTVASSPQWLAATMRLLLKRVDSLEAQLRDHEPRQVCLDELVPDFPGQPPGLHSSFKFNAEAAPFVSLTPEVQFARIFDYLMDVDTHAIDADTSNFSPDDFAAPGGSDDYLLDAANNDAAKFEILTAEVFDTEDVPSPDNFIQKNAHSPKCSKHMSAVDDGEQYEFGDVEAHAIDADTSDFSPHQNQKVVKPDFEFRNLCDPQQMEYIQQTQVAPMTYSAPATTCDVCSSCDSAPATTLPAPVTYAAPQQVDYIQQSQVDYGQQAPVTYAAPLTFQTIDNNPLPDDGGGLLINIQQTQVENVQQAPVKFAAPLTYAAPEFLPTAGSMVAAPQQYQFAPATYAFEFKDLTIKLRSMRLKTYSFREAEDIFFQDDYEEYFDEDDYADLQYAGFLTPEDETVSWCASFDG